MENICNKHCSRDCRDCQETFSSVSQLALENQNFKKEINNTNQRIEQLQQKLTHLKKQYSELSRTQSIQLPLAFLKTKSPKDYFMNLKLPSNFFSLLTEPEYSLSLLFQTGTFDSESLCSCGRAMSIRWKEGMEASFQCVCGKTKPLLEESFWKGLEMEQSKILAYLFLWTMDLRPREIANFLDISQNQSRKVSEKLRKVVGMHFLDSLPCFSGIVEIDESCFRSKGKSDQKWVFGLYERASKLVYMEVVPKRTAAQLLPIITKRCEPGTTIMSDQWAAYNQLEKAGFKHHTVNHSKYFLHPENPEIHTQHIEVSWCWAKYHIKKKNRQMTHLQEHLHEYCWKTQFRNNSKLHELGSTMKSLFEVLKNYSKSSLSKC